ncbi:Peptidyl-prolyl cis-trans isomerase FKBP19 [Cardamine amara subsp. amara]|uniref:peptidylprolyl isomerase n=1 Tax=Cardamine amara subsp. amara TaxID=228776 RepID=A0ABD1AJU8_CARAN
MASISSFGYLPQSTALTGTSSTTRSRTTVAARLADQTDDFSSLRSSSGNCGCVVSSGEFDRRKMLVSSVGLLIGALTYDAKDGAFATASQFADMPALRGKDYGKTKMKYPDYTETPSGLQYKDLRLGTGPKPNKGDKVVVDWDGYTIGYYGRIFEARNKTKGGSFEGDDKEFFKFTLGSDEVIPAFEEAVAGMALGGIRRIIVPPELGYPENDYNKSGPKPMTFSGQRALDFVLRNQGLIDKTLLFDVELLKILPN